MDRRIVLDIETKGTFDEAGGRGHFENMQISVVGVYDYATDQYRAYEEKELGQLQNVVINSSLIVGFNHVGFDMPILQNYFSIDVKKLPLFDIMLDFQQKMGHRIALDSIAQATLGVGKSGSGLDAIRYFREGKIAELKEYCLNDVKVTRQIFDYGIEHGKIAFISKMGHQKKELAVDWKKYKKPKSDKENPPQQAQYKLF